MDIDNIVEQQVPVPGDPVQVEANQDPDPLGDLGDG